MFDEEEKVIAGGGGASRPARHGWKGEKYQHDFLQ